MPGVRPVRAAFTATAVVPVRPLWAGTEGMDSFTIVSLPVSATSDVAALSTATPRGEAITAARVVTTPAGVILRIVVVALVGHVDVARAVHRHPVRDNRSVPRCPCRRRPAPGRPANVVTTPAGVILRIVLLPCPPRRCCPSCPPPSRRDESNARRCRCRRAADLPAVPANVVTTPAGVILRIVLLPVSAT